ncbi:MAG: single-stranded-DNA-specific exonuclease RecJ, partial [Proteobacteria bacterium]|nr:single-stranded-DNA-specific exonuclease RecJ [Pseudomonadota bacterium]
MGGNRPLMGEDAFLGVANSITGRFWYSRLDDERTALALQQRLGISELLARVLAARGVSLDAAEGYLDPKLRTDLPDPSSFQDMANAAQRMVRAITQREAIAVFGDYDVDGATSAALLLRFLRAVGSDARLYVPDRLTEGYGPNPDALRQLRREGSAVAITVDCGIVAFDALAAAAEVGLDIIVVDHHLAQAELPIATAIVNPNRLDDTAPHKQLAAVGVAFLLVVAVNRALRDAGWYAERREPELIEWLDLVALGTICDVVPLTGVNRALVAQGLKVMARRGNCGIAALADVARIEEPPSTYHAGFLLGPRVNAGGRVGRSDLGARLLSTDNADEARQLAEQLDRLNAERRTIEAQVEEEAVAIASEQSADNPLVFVAGRGWHPGVVGIVASRLKDRFRKPTMVIGFEHESGRGSGRSVPGVDLGGAVAAARQAGLLINGGGHPMAAGLTVAVEKVAALGEFLMERVARSGFDPNLPARLAFDGALSSSGISNEILDELERAGPYGSGNAKPRF